MQFQDADPAPHTSVGSRERSRSNLPLWKKAAYGLLIAVLFFGVIEGVLALLNVDTMLAQTDPFVGFESAVRLYVERSDDNGEVVLCTANNKLDFFNAQQFPKEKPENSIRVFCLGGSTTFGRPYDDATSFPGWMRELLPAADNTKRWEVINAGGISYASYRVAALMEELCNYDPDVFVLYTGHNEFLEERTYHPIREMPAAIRRLSTILGRTRSYSVLHSLMRHENPDQP